MKTWRLIPDVNVLLSSLTSRRGPSFDLLQAARRFDVVLVLAEIHFIELAEVLTYPQVLALGGHALTPSRAFWAAFELRRIGEYVEQVPRLDWPSCPDREDWYLLDLLTATDADGLVTKDKHLLRLHGQLGLPVYEPRELVRLSIL